MAGTEGSNWDKPQVRETCKGYITKGDVFDVCEELNSSHIDKLFLIQLYIPLSDPAPASMCWPLFKCLRPPLADLVLLSGWMMLCLHPIYWTGGQEGIWDRSLEVVQAAVCASCARPRGLALHGEK